MTASSSPSTNPSTTAAATSANRNGLDPRLTPVWIALKVTYALVPIVAGADKFAHILTDWTKYLNPLVLKVVPISATTFMHIAGVIEIVLGILVLTKLTEYAAAIVSVYLVLIALTLITYGHYLDVAARDVAMAVGAFSLSRLAHVRGRGEVRAPSTATTTPTTTAVPPRTPVNA